MPTLNPCAHLTTVALGPSLTSIVDPYGSIGCGGFSGEGWGVGSLFITISRYVHA